MSNIHIRRGTEADLPQVLDLIKELAIYEKAEGEVINTVQQLTEDGFGDNPIYGLFVAELDGQIQGISLYYTKYSTWKGRCIFLEDIIVNEEHRGMGLGSQLFDRTVQLAESLGVKRLEWQVLDWNQSAIEFYKRKGAIVEPEWVNMKIVFD